MPLFEVDRKAMIDPLSRHFTMMPSVMVSRCLMGHSVRYDGGHKAHARVQALHRLGWVTSQPCPEVEAGLPVPRAPIDLIEINHGFSVVERGDWSSFDAVHRCRGSQIHSGTLRISPGRIHFQVSRQVVLLEAHLCRMALR